MTDCMCDKLLDSLILANRKIGRMETHLAASKCGGDSNDTPVISLSVLQAWDTYQGKGYNGNDLSYASRYKARAVLAAFFESAKCI
ncbi:hypothetical protein D3Y57_19900 [Sphingomonas paeninsulae]|uniref:Uncharacterized protein n=1 Tax=Sphingomonas paeninsulae TaxID=2319844 RepID=A0A494TRP4_SPHPE|nr:hypothetical protein D3Y57_19900 [Sphingomonas paeninsulae]